MRRTLPTRGTQDGCSQESASRRGARFRKAPAGAVPPDTQGRNFAEGWRIASVLRNCLSGQVFRYKKQESALTHLSPQQHFKWHEPRHMLCCWTNLSFSSRVSLLRSFYKHWIKGGLSKPWESDAISGRRRVRSYLIQAASWAPTIGEKDSCLEALEGRRCST